MRVSIEFQSWIKNEVTKSLIPHVYIPFFVKNTICVKYRRNKQETYFLERQTDPQTRGQTGILLNYLRYLNRYEAYECNMKVSRDSYGTRYVRQMFISMFISMFSIIFKCMFRLSYNHVYTYTYVHLLAIFTYNFQPTLFCSNLHKQNIEMLQHTANKPK